MEIWVNAAHRDDDVSQVRDNAHYYVQHISIPKEYVGHKEAYSHFMLKIFHQKFLFERKRSHLVHADLFPDAFCRVSAPCLEPVQTPNFASALNLFSKVHCFY